MNKNYGLVINPPSETDYVFGASAFPSEVLEPTGQWDKDLPVFESQAFPNFEPSSCASGGTLNAIEVLIKRMMAEENFSERWLAWNSGTTEIGNDPQVVAEFLRKVGTPFEERWKIRDATSFEDFYKAPPAKLFDYAKEDFLNRFNFKHYIVPNEIETIKEALTHSPLGMSVAAWYEIGGKFYKPDGTWDNHWVLCYGWDDEKKAWKVFDTYDMEKKLYSFESKPQRVKSYFLKKKLTQEQVSYFQKIISAVLEALGLIQKQINELPKEIPKEIPEVTKPVKESLIEKWALAIQDFEGYTPGSKSYRNNNPGNVKGMDGKFLVFKTYEAGFDYLCDYLKRACTGQHKAYKPDMNLKQFFLIYAPDPEPIPTNYTNFVATKMGVYPSVLIKNLL